MDGVSDSALSCCSPSSPSLGGTPPSGTGSPPTSCSCPGVTSVSVASGATSPAVASEASPAASWAGGASCPPSDCASAETGGALGAAESDGGLLSSSSSEAFHPILLNAEPGPADLSAEKFCTWAPAVLFPQVDGCKLPHLKASSSRGTSGSGSASTIFCATFPVVTGSGGPSTGSCGSASGSLSTGPGARGCSEGGGASSVTASGCRTTSAASPSWVGGVVSPAAASATSSWRMRAAWAARCASRRLPSASAAARRDSSCANRSSCAAASGAISTAIPEESHCRRSWSSVDVRSSNVEPLDSLLNARGPPTSLFFWLGALTPMTAPFAMPQIVSDACALSSGSDKSCLMAFNRSSWVAESFSTSATMPRDSSQALSYTGCDTTTSALSREAPSITAGVLIKSEAQLAVDSTEDGSQIAFSSKLAT
mmetsp:Transcript_9056/g.21635  ORF Transcript_9056/g.21635 Transcript_9056/m.21635 type:complete len:426 (-) Transcript_9056:644-1921(-)